MMLRTYDAAKNESFIYFLRRNFHDLWIYRFAIFNLIHNAVVMRYRRSLLGVLWSLINPLLMMFVMTVAFSILFQQDPLRFSTYVLSGLVGWGFISGSITTGMNALIASEGFLRKLYAPKLMFPLVTVGVELVNMGFSLICYFVVGLIVGLHVGLPFILLPFVLLLMLVFSYGLALFMSVITVYFRDIAHITGVIIQALFYTLPIIYPLENFPESSRIWFYFNPFYHYIALLRQVLYYGEWPTAAEWGITIMISLISLLLGVAIMKLRDRDLVYRL